jgi:hypothetical protein
MSEALEYNWQLVTETMAIKAMLVLTHIAYPETSERDAY